MPETPPLPQEVSDVPIFLCYRRVDGDKHAQWLFQALHGHVVAGAAGLPSARLTVYFDQTAPATEDWTKIHFPRLMLAKALIVICTPGVRNNISQPGSLDWVHEELDWWCANRKQAPILIDTTGDDRWIPDRVRRRWPRNNRIEVSANMIAESGRDGPEAARVRDRVAEGILHSQRAVIFEDLERFRRLTRRLSVALGIAGVGILLAVGFAVAAWSSAQTAAVETERAQTNADEAWHHLGLSRELVGEGLTLRSAMRLGDDPAEAFVLAFAAARFTRTEEPLHAMYRALHANPVWRRLMVPDAPAGPRPLLAPLPDATDPLAVDRAMSLIATATPRNAASIEGDWSLHLHDIDSASHLASRRLDAVDRLVTAHPLASEIYALRREQSGLAQLELYSLTRDGWDKPLLSVPDALDWTTAGGQWPAFVVLANGAVLAAERDANGAVQPRVLAHRPGTVRIAASASGDALALAGPSGMAWVDVPYGALHELPRPPRDPADEQSRPPEADSMHFIPGADVLLALYSQQALYKPDIHRSVWAVFPRTGALIRLPCAPVPVFPGIHVIFEMSRDGKRLAISERTDGGACVGIYDLAWSSAGNEVSATRHGEVPLDDQPSDRQLSTVASLAPSGRYLVVGGTARERTGGWSPVGSVRSWDLSEPYGLTGEYPAPVDFNGVRAPVARVQHSEDSSRVLTWDATATTQVFQVILQPPANFGAGVRTPTALSRRFFAPDLTFHGQGRFVTAAFSATDVRAIDLVSGQEHRLDALTGGAPILAASWHGAGVDERMLVTSREFLRAGPEGVLERHVFERPAQHARVVGHLAVASSGPRVDVFQRGAHPLTTSFTLPDAVTSVAVHEHEQRVWVYASTSRSVHSWRLAADSPPAELPSVELPAEVQSWEGAGDHLVSLVGAEHPVPWLYDLRGGRAKRPLAAPDSGWPDRPERMTVLAIRQDGAADLVLSTSNENFIGRWDPAGRCESWRALPSGALTWVEPSADPDGAIAVIRAYDGSVKLVSLPGGAILDETSISPLSHVPPPVVSNERPRFAVTPAFAATERHIALGGLEEPGLVTNVPLPDALGAELELLSRAFESTTRQLAR